MAAEKILSALAAKDRLIASQALVMDLAKQVLGSTDIQGTVKTLVQAAYKVVDADRVSLYLLEDNVLVCHLSPEGDHGHIPLGSGIVGRVGKTGETINLEDAYTRPDIFDVTQDLLTEYTTRSVLCLPLRDRDGEVIGVIQAINKHGLGKEPVPFEKHDERSLELLLALTSQQVHFSELIVQRDRAVKRAESMLHLVEAMSAERETHAVATALGNAAIGLLHCRWALIFLRDLGSPESKSMVCRAAVPCSPIYSGETGLNLDLDEALLGEVVKSGRPIVFDSEATPTELEELHQRLMPCFGDVVQMQARSALCAPLPDARTGKVVGMVVAIDRFMNFGDADEEATSRTPTPPGAGVPRMGRARTRSRRFSASTALRTMLSHGKCTWSFNVDSEAGKFCEADLDAVTLLSQSAGNILQTTALYNQECRIHRQMGALVDLITESRRLASENQPSELVAHVSSEGRKVFDCDRCTFFTLDQFNQQLVGFYTLKHFNGEEEVQSLNELRVPIKGIVGHVAKTRTPLNIQDAWNEPRFNREMDMKTGYRTRTILCAPVIAVNGRLVGILQCINKNDGRTFGENDMEMLNMVSISLADLIQQTLLENSYDSFIKGNASISNDVKDMFAFFEKGTKSVAKGATENQRLMQTGAKKMSAVLRLARSCGTAPRQPPSGRHRSSLSVVESLDEWDFNLQPLAEDLAMVDKGFRFAMERLRVSGTMMDKVAAKVRPFIQGLQDQYSTTAAYHDWSHALTTWHATFLLLNSPAFCGLLPHEEIFALLIAAFGHDVEHPGTTNNFQVNSFSSLAIRYNDQSVLENHHAAVTSRILKETELVDDLELPSRQRIRLVLVNAILNTDMIKHKDNLAWMESSNIDMKGLQRSNQTLERDVGLKLGSALLHCADLVHPAMPWEMHKHMSLLISEEFYAQFQEEQRLGLPTLPFMGKDPTNLVELAPIQMGFIQFVAKPLWSALSFVAGKDRLDEVVLNVEDNRERWKKLADNEEIPEDQPQPFRQPKKRTDVSGGFPPTPVEVQVP